MPVLPLFVGDPPTVLVATCAPGDFATGGGYILGSPDVAVISSSLGGTPSEWAVSVLNFDPILPVDVTVTVQCADLFP